MEERRDDFQADHLLAAYARATDNLSDVTGCKQEREDGADDDKDVYDEVALLTLSVVVEFIGCADLDDTGLGFGDETLGASRAKWSAVVAGTAGRAPSSAKGVAELSGPENFAFTSGLEELAYYADV